MSALVSVVVPVYNLEKYIENCLKSIVAQTYKNLEIICIDDGSTDGSARIIKEFAGTDERIKYFYQRNQGLSATRNEGIRISELKYVYNNKISVNSKISERDFYSISIADMFYKYKCGYMVNGSLFKRDLIFDKRFMESIKNGEDSIFMLQVILCSPKTVFIDDVCYYYYVRDDSLSRNIKYNIGMADIVNAASICYELAKEAGNDTLISIYLRGIYSTLFEHRIRCKHSECQKEVERRIKSTGKKYLKSLFEDPNILQTEKFAIAVSFKIPIMYKFFRILKDPSMFGIYLRGKL